MAMRILRTGWLVALLPLLAMAVSTEAAPPAPAVQNGAPQPTTAAPTPASAPSAKSAAKPAGDALNELRRDVDRIKDQLVRSRARAKTLDKMVHGTAVTLMARYGADRHYVLRELEMSLDGANLFELGPSGLGDTLREITRTAVSPGLHTFTVRLAVKARGNDRLGYRSEQSFSVEVPEGKPVRLEVTLDEDGDLPGYAPKVELRVREGA